MKICIISHYGLGALSNSTLKGIGGVEKQTSLTAHWLAKRGHEVSFVIFNTREGTTDDHVNGIRVIRMCYKSDGLPLLRFFHPHWTSLIQSLKKADSDIYYYNMAEAATGQIALWCKKNRKPFFYSVANEPDVDKRLPKMNTFRERYLYRKGLKYAEKIVVQTKSQQDLLKKDFGQDSTIIPMPSYDLGANTRSDASSCDALSKPILWIARFSEQKRPDRLISIAQSNPDLRFIMVGPYERTVYGRSIADKAEQLPNIKLVGPVSQSDVKRFYENACCLLCTSDYEGFPNTFLEAWSCKVPVITTFDPDNVVFNHKLGYAVSNTSKSIVEGINLLLSSAKDYDRIGRNCREYYENFHTIDNCLQSFERLFEETLQTNP